MRDHWQELPHQCINCGAGYHGARPARLCCCVTSGN
jgi:predicted  nucleic acid-binding Zn-ribbon protein